MICFDWPGPLRGKVRRMVFAAGSFWNWAGVAEEGSYLKGMVLSWPVVVVAAKVRCEDLRRGMRKWDVHPAPRIRTSTGVRVSISMWTSIGFGC